MIFTICTVFFDFRPLLLAVFLSFFGFLIFLLLRFEGSTIIFQSLRFHVTPLRNDRAETIENEHLGLFSPMNRHLASY